MTAGAAILVITALGAALDVMETDAAQYAAMSRDLLSGGDPLRITMRGEDHLDKPPLLFWTAALSFKLFGVHTWSYKLPSILFAFGGVYATYRLARLHHPVEVARIAALCFASTAAFLVMTNDVRCDTLLTGSVIMATWLGAEYIERRSWKHLLGCAAAIGSGMLAKGPIGSMAPLLALGPPLLIQRRWAVLRDPRLLLVPLIVAAMLLPMCIGLWRQHGMEGLRFYFWGQSFGRITGENPWRDDSSILYFTHEILWLMIPWTLFALIGLWRDLRTWVTRGSRALPELITLCGSLIVFTVLSFSHYKLPHYLYPILPLICIIAARAIASTVGPAPALVQLGLMTVLAGLAAVLSAWSFPEGGLPWLVVIAVGVAGAMIVFVRSRGHERVVWPTLAIMCAAGLAINGHVYPAILRYQANAVAGKLIATEGIAGGRFFGFNTGGHALDFYAGHAVPWYNTMERVKPLIGPGTVVYVDAEHRRQLLDWGLAPGRELSIDHYPVQLLSRAFLDPRRREAVLSKRYLLFY